MRHAPLLKLLALFGLCVLTVTAGCAPGSSARSRFYMPVALVAPGDEPPQAKAGGIRVGIGPIRLAEYLDRPQIVTRDGGVLVQLAEFERWAEPLEDSVARVVAENVSRLMGDRPLEVFPWNSSADPAFQVRGEILRLDGELGGDAVLEAWFSIVGSTSRKGESRKVAYREPAGPDYASLVLAESRLLERLSRDIAAALSEKLGEP